MPGSRFDIQIHQALPYRPRGRRPVRAHVRGPHLFRDVRKRRRLVYDELLTVPPARRGCVLGPVAAIHAWQFRFAGLLDRFRSPTSEVGWAIVLARASTPDVALFHAAPAARVACQSRSLDPGLSGGHQHRAREDLARRAGGRRSLGTGRRERRRAARSTPRGGSRAAGVRPGDVLLRVDGARDRDRRRRVRTRCTRRTMADASALRRPCGGVGRRAPLTSACSRCRSSRTGLYYSLALVGILAIVRRRVGAAAAAERSGDAAFFLADGVVLRRARVHAERPLRPARLLLRLGGSGRAARAAAAVPPLRARVSRSRRTRGCRTRGRPCVLPLFYLPALVLGLGRALVMARPHPLGPTRRSGSRDSRRGRTCIWPHACSAAWPSCCARSTRLRSVTARRQLRLDRLGIVARRAAVRAAVPVPFLLGHALPARSTRPCCSAASRSRSPRPSSATG